MEHSGYLQDDIDAISKHISVHRLVCQIVGLHIVRYNLIAQNCSSNKDLMMKISTNMLAKSSVFKTLKRFYISQLLNFDDIWGHIQAIVYNRAEIF